MGIWSVRPWEMFIGGFGWICLVEVEGSWLVMRLVPVLWIRIDTQ